MAYSYAKKHVGLLMFSICTQINVKRMVEMEMKKTLFYWISLRCECNDIDVKEIISISTLIVVTCFGIVINSL